MLEQQMWNEYIRINPNVKYYEAWSFGGNTPEMPNILANLVLKGIKTATSSAYPSYIEENSVVPPVGGYKLTFNVEFSHPL